MGSVIRVGNNLIFETTPDSQAISAELLMTGYSVYLIMVVQNSKYLCMYLN